jgi:imidazolonepropionase-like amidohydrolase
VAPFTRFLHERGLALRAAALIGVSVVACGCVPAESRPLPATSVTVFEGARVVVGDGSAPIEDAGFIVQDGRFTQVGPRGRLQVPAGATRVDLTGKTVTPPSGEAGVLAPGATADFVVLDADPLNDTTTRRRPATVYVKGMVVDRDRR